MSTFRPTAYMYRVFADQVDKLITFNSVIIKAMHLQLVPIERSI